MPRTPTGILTPTGPAIRHAGATVPLPRAQTPAGQWVAQVVADLDAGRLVACPHCGQWGGCECAAWLEYMAAQPPAPLDVMTEYDIPV